MTRTNRDILRRVMLQLERDLVTQAHLRARVKAADATVTHRRTRALPVKARITPPGKRP
jgi:hypothetical protein